MQLYLRNLLENLVKLRLVCPPSYVQLQNQLSLNQLHRFLCWLPCSVRYSNFLALLLGLWTSRTHNMWYLYCYSVQGYFGAIQCTCLKMPCNSKTVMALKRNRLKFAPRGVLVIHMWGRNLPHPVHALSIKEHLYRVISVTYSCRQAICQGH